MMTMGERLAWFAFSVAVSALAAGTLCLLVGFEYFLGGFLGYAGGCAIWVFLISPILERDI